MGSGGIPLTVKPENTAPFDDDVDLPNPDGEFLDGTFKVVVGPVLPILMLAVDEAVN